MTPDSDNIRWNYEKDRWEEYGAGGVWIEYSPDRETGSIEGETNGSDS